MRDEPAMADPRGPAGAGEGAQLLPVRDVRQRTGLSKQAIYNMEKRGDFPRRRKVIGRRVGWLEHEVDEWIRSRPKAEDVRDSLEGQQ